MKLIDPSYEIIEQEGCGLLDIYKHIELCGRTCYKSEDKITEGSAEKFVKRMIDNNHTAMLEHGTVYLKMNQHAAQEYMLEKHSKVNQNGDDYYVTTNLRVIVENDWWGDLAHICQPTEYHELRHTVKLTTSLHVYKDLTRHRTMSFAIESTRYCNYSKNKFGGELTFIKPCWLIDDPAFEATLSYIEEGYLQLIEHGWQAQQAAEVLSQCVKGDVIITGFESDWNHVFDLRALGTTGAPHPEVKRIITPIMEEFHEKGWTDRTLQEIDDVTMNNSSKGKPGHGYGDGGHYGPPGHNKQSDEYEYEQELWEN